MIELKIVLYTFVLCILFVRLPFKKSGLKIIDFSKNSFLIMNDDSMNDDEKSLRLRKNSGYLFVETLKIALWLLLVVGVGFVLWYLINIGADF